MTPASRYRLFSLVPRKVVRGSQPARFLTDKQIYLYGGFWRRLCGNAPSKPVRVRSVDAKVVTVAWAA
jgi:hypothetical protein